jgi:NAD(P)-dependent dehydrogenase (short-subunit alcohol dehydrogenase family)
MDLKHTAVIITGAAGSLGQAVAAAFVEAGARRVLVDVSESGLRAAYPGNDPQQLLAATDLLDPASVARTVDAALAKFGRIDALCNIAGGFTMGTPVHATPAADWKRMWDVNAQTMLNAVQAQSRPKPPAMTWPLTRAITGSVHSCRRLNRSTM